jgi:hypothetical protein
MPPRRPVIDGDQIRVWRQARFSWTWIAQQAHVSISFLRDWRADNNFEDPLRRIQAGDELDDIVTDMVRTDPFAGERMMMGYIRRTLQLRVTREDLRNAIRNVDPEGREARRYTPEEPREPYVSEGPGHVSHADTNHKLGFYGIVIFAVIDGYSREIQALSADGNKKARSLLHSWATSWGIESNGFPQLLRVDHGMENVAIARWQVETGGNWHPGKSTRNQRVERLWRDVYEQVSRFYKELFQLWETEYEIDFSVPENVWILQHLFLARINEHLTQFMAGWNAHPMEGVQNNFSPEQLRMAARRNLYRLLGPAALAEAARIQEELEEEYPGNGVIASSLCPFDNEQELATFLDEVPRLRLADHRDTMDARMALAFEVAQRIISERQ